MDEFEALLREFQPRRPGPLPRRPKTQPALWVLGAAAAAAVVSVVMTVVERDFRSAGNTAVGRNAIVAQGAAHDTVPTVGSLTPLALSDPAALDAALTRMSQALLPDVEQPNRALSALGRESK